jgi:transporter family-2 protein
MNYGLSIFVGFIISIMVALNGVLTGSLGIYHATLIAHIFGITVVILILLFRKQKIKIISKVPLYYFIGGFLGVLTTVFNNQAFSYLGVSIMLALCLFGQSVTSLILDALGVFNHKANNNYKTYIGLFLLVIGILVMILY